jgi:hypothetical protein
MSDIPLGEVPSGRRIEQRQQINPFPQELTNALRKVRDECGGRWCIAVFSADETGDLLNLFLQRGPTWNDDRSFLKAYQLFVAEFLRISPDLLARIDRPSASQPPAIIPDIERVEPQATFGPAPASHPLL